MTVLWCRSGDGAQRKLEAPPGMTLMLALRKHGFDIEAACGGSLACATCHVIFDEPWQGRVPPPSEDEEGLLESLVDVTPMSRLSCQIQVTPEMENLTFRIA